MKHIFNKLNLTQENGLFLTKESNWKGIFSNRVERLLNNIIQPDAFFCIDKKPFILFFENPKDKKKKLKEVWNFNESPIVIVTEGDSLEIYNGFEFITKHESLALFGGAEKLNDFSYFELVTGQAWEKYQKDFSYKNRIDYKLLENIKDARDLLIKEGVSVELTNSLLGKVIFVRYLIDREVQLDFEERGQSRKWTNNEFCTLLSDKPKVKGFFTYLKNKFNGDLFPISNNEIDSISQNSFILLIKLLSGDEVASGQTSLFNLYDFSIIPVEFISNVYELFIGKNQQESKGAYYTPLFLVDYILSETVKKKFEKHLDLYTCKVLDPACGSGVFLVEALRKIIEQFQRNNPLYLNDIVQYKEKLKLLATENIFGIDKDKSAVNVAVFSIYLTLLDYQQPSDIETFQFPPLKGSNFFEDDFFNTEAAFNNKLRTISFDFILGNPPWKRGKGEGKPLFEEYITHRKKSEKGRYDNEIGISNSEIAQAFIFRVSDFSKPTTQISLIATSKVLYNLNAKGFRLYLLDQFNINKVFELAPVRKEVFDKSNDKAIAPAVVLFYQFAFGSKTDENIIEHISLKPSRFFSLFKVFTIQRSDYKKIVQSKLKAFDYLWKVLMYGSYLDFNFINRLKQSFPYLNQILSNQEKFLIGQGAMIGGGNKNDALHLLGKRLLDTRKDIKPFWVNENPKFIWQHEVVHRPRNRSLYEAPFVLITGGINKYFKSVSAVSTQDAVFLSSLTAIKSIDGNNNILNSICAILNSSIYAYFGLQTHSSLGIEREESHDEEKFNIPFIDNKNISTTVEQLTRLKQQLYSTNSLLEPQIEYEIKDLEDTLDSEIIKAFFLNSQEKSLLNYSNNITIPMIMKHKGYEHIFKPLLPNSQNLTDYINLFVKRFENSFKKSQQKLKVDVHHTNQLIGLFFKLVPTNEQTELINYVKTDNDKVLMTLTRLGNEKITDRLFIQKDIRGFEKDGFYIVKPNEKRLWHQAIAYLDLNEFVDAILTSGKKQKSNVCLI